MIKYIKFKKPVLNLKLKFLILNNSNKCNSKKIFEFNLIFLKRNLFPFRREDFK